jgi:hypothetical protein
MPGFASILVGLCVTIGFILIFASGQHQHVRLWRGIGSVFLSIPAAALTYLMLGVRLAHRYGEARFYSWPIGGGAYRSNHTVIAMSLLFWLLVWSAVLFGASNLLPVDKEKTTRRTGAKELKTES